MTNQSMSDQLKAPFEDVDLIKTLVPDSIWIDSECGPVGLYATEIATVAIHERLDQVFGFDGWETFVDTLTGGESSGIRCQLRTHYMNGRSIIKTGVSLTEKGNMNEALKKAFHSAVRLYGVGRYLDSLDDEWAPVSAEELEDLGMASPDQNQENLSQDTPVSARTSQEELMEDIPFPSYKDDAVPDKPESQPSVAENSSDRFNQRIASFRQLPPSQPTPDYPH